MEKIKSIVYDNKHTCKKFDRYKIHLLNKVNNGFKFN